MLRRMKKEAMKIICLCARVTAEETNDSGIKWQSCGDKPETLVVDSLLSKLGSTMHAHIQKNTLCVFMNI